MNLFYFTSICISIDFCGEIEVLGRSSGRFRLRNSLEIDRLSLKISMLQCLHQHTSLTGSKRTQNRER